MKIKDILNSPITKDVAETVGNKIGIDWNKVDIEEFLIGINIELEHGSSDPETDVIGDDLEAAGKVAWAHIKEIPDYYTRLKDMESEAGLDEEYKDKYGRPSAAKRGYGHKWRKKRKEIIDRDEGKCVKCGAPANEVDHIRPKSRDGKDINSNLRTLCGECHRKKTKKYDTLKKDV